MKQDRHSAIRELVAGAPIGSQDELRRRLVKRGFEVTQATLSRDIHELHLYKGPNGYAAPNGAADDDDDVPQDVIDKYGIVVSCHDLRRSFITTAESADISAIALKALVNHAVGGNVTENYIQMSPERLREPAQRVTDRLKQLCGIEAPASENLARIGDRA